MTLRQLEGINHDVSKLLHVNWTSSSNLDRQKYIWYDPVRVRVCNLLNVEAEHVAYPINSQNILQENMKCCPIKIFTPTDKIEFIWPSVNVKTDLTSSWKVSTTSILVSCVSLSAESPSSLLMMEP